MKIKKDFNFKRSWKTYKADKDFENKKEAKAAFLEGCAVAFLLTTEGVADIKSLKKQFEALSFMKSQADDIFAEDEDGLPENIKDALKQVFEGYSALVKARKEEIVSFEKFDLRDEDVEEKFEATLKDSREKMEKLKSEGGNFGFEVGCRFFSYDQIDEGLTFARDAFYKSLEKTRAKDKAQEKGEASEDEIMKEISKGYDEGKDPASIADAEDENRNGE